MGKWSFGIATRSRTLLALLAFVLAVGVVPHRWCEIDGHRFFEGDVKVVDALAERVARTTSKRVDPATFTTGSALFDEEWQYGTFMMAAMGFAQTAIAREGQARAMNVVRLERCLDALLSVEGRSFDRRSWKTDPIETLSSRGDRDRGHVAYLGYTGLALGLHRLLVGESRFSKTHDALIAALDRRFASAPNGFIETYPHEIYPVDNASGLGAIALHARATGRASPGLARGLAAIRRHGIDPATGLLVQSVGADAKPRDGARGSGTALAAYFLSFADVELSSSLHRALASTLYRTTIGFGAVLEHADGGSRSDIDSGPIVLGFGVSATGFALGSSRAHDDHDTFVALYATAHLFGAPFDEGGARTYVTGGPLGDAILFAMVTAPRARGDS